MQPFKLYDAKNAQPPADALLATVEEKLQQFLDTGYTPAHVLEVILGICVKTFSNLANNAIGIPLDDEFAGHAWQPGTHHQAA